MSAEQREVVIVNDANYRDFFTNSQIVLMMGMSEGYSCKRYRDSLGEIAEVFPWVNFGAVWRDIPSKIKEFQKDRPDIFDAFDRPPTTLFVEAGLLRPEYLSGYYPQADVCRKITLVFKI